MLEGRRHNISQDGAKRNGEPVAAVVIAGPNSVEDLEGVSANRRIDQTRLPLFEPVQHVFESLVDARLLQGYNQRRVYLMMR